MSSPFLLLLEPTNSTAFLCTFYFFLYPSVIDKGKYSYDGKKAYIAAKLRVGAGVMAVNSVNFILSPEGEGDDLCWMIDSILICPPSMRR